MKIALVTDAWMPQVNGVVTTLVELVRELTAAGHDLLVVQPGDFRTRPCPGYPGIDLAVAPRRQLAAQLDAFQPDAIHLATEGPLGWAGRRYCLRRRLAFTTAFHTKFPEILHAAAMVPVGWGYALFRHFHRPSSGVMVPTRSVLAMLERRGFRNLRAWTHGVDTGLFGFSAQPLPHDLLRDLPRPIALFVGRVSYEKNIQAFLETDLPGSKVVCGVGPVEAPLKARHPHVRWIGLLSRPELARLYAAADVLVFPSHADTFGLVMVEAMAAGTPVAAYPVDGPLEVLGRPHPDGGRSLGGTMHEDLGTAIRSALSIPRVEARERALDFSWAHASRLFADFLVPARHPVGDARPTGAVTTLSSSR
ncbi:MULTISPECIES: glycosyltransferase family 4 protein [Ramlibacter]|uniref:Glycosyltransferase n=1 Tax=Ramlibacter pinisoli TaxID=2682844 RepID=A0A6N8IYV9_9BURK|nr:MULTISPECIES: glycosyltransferase family 1 protein [Ramlibacter]MBA2961286.1 glycosyltransferase family 1 protein [Ramlibacter sp. CGMCC 1.13660]MVQ31230.1 glycosyltransferase [Ramlibacter pinisoli]